MEELLDVMLDSDIPVRELTSLIMREVQRRKELARLKDSLAYQIHSVLVSIDGYWELHQYDDGIGISMEDWNPDMWVFLGDDVGIDEGRHLFNVPSNTVYDVLLIDELAPSLKITSNLSHLSAM